MLTPGEQSKFMKVFSNPNSELALQLLSSERLEKEIKKPWWETSVGGEDEEETFPQSRSSTHPNMMKIPASMVKPVPSGHPLVYNMCAIWSVHVVVFPSKNLPNFSLAYAYITRHLGVSPLHSLSPDDPERREILRLVAKLVPFLTDRMSIKLYPNLPAVITDFWSTFDLVLAILNFGPSVTS